MIANAHKKHEEDDLVPSRLLSPMPQEKVPINIVSKSVTYWLYKLFSGYRAIQRYPFLSKSHLQFYLHHSMLKKPENIDTL